jgi:hypothetical protein
MQHILQLTLHFVYCRGRDSNQVFMSMVNQALLLHEHGQPGIRKQLQTLWTEWLEKTYCDEQQVLAAVAGLEMVAATQPDDDNVVSTAAAGVLWASLGLDILKDNAVDRL